MKLILTQEVDRPRRRPATWSRSRTATAATTSSRAGSRIRWTRGGEKTVESIKAARAARAVRDQDHADEIKAKLEVRAGQRQGARR